MSDTLTNITRDYSSEALEVFCMHQEKSVEQFEKEIMGGVQAILQTCRDKLSCAAITLNYDQCGLAFGLTDKRYDEDVADRISEIDISLAQSGWKNIKMSDSPCNTPETLRGYASFLAEDSYT